MSVLRRVPAGRSQRIEFLAIPFQDKSRIQVERSEFEPIEPIEWGQRVQHRIEACVFVKSSWYYELAACSG